MKLLAATTDLGPISGEGFGPFGNIPLTSTSGLVGLTKTISSVIGFMTICAGIWFLFQIVFAGYQWVSSGGEKAKLQEARDRMTHAFIGLTIVVGAWALLAVAGKFFGYDILVGHPETIIEQLKLGL